MTQFFRTTRNAVLAAIACGSLSACIDEVGPAASDEAVIVASTQGADPVGSQDVAIPWEGPLPAIYTDDDALVDAVRSTEGRVFIGFKEPGEGKIHNRPTFNRAGVRHVMRPAVSPGTVVAGRNLLMSRGAQLTKLYRQLPSVAAIIDPDAAPALREHPLVDFILPDELLEAQSTLAPRVTSWSSMFQGGSQQIPWAMDQIRAPEVHSAGYTGNNVIITIIDRGLELHEDLPTVELCVIFAGGSGCGGSADSYHGMRMAGAAAMLDNNIGYLGAAPGARLWAYRVFDNTGGQSGTVSNLVQAIEWAANNGVREILSMSVSFGGSFNVDLHNAVQDAFQSGDLLVASAGNSPAGGSLRQPALMANVIAVTAVTQAGHTRNDALCCVYGGPDLAAPDSVIESTRHFNQYDTAALTSGAAAQVSGVAALVWQRNPTWTNVTLRSKLASSASTVDVHTSGWDNRTGWGRIDAWKAVFGAAATLTASISGPSTVSAPSTWFADWDGGLAPWTWTWSGVLSGGGTSVSGLPSSSGFLYLTVSSFDGQQKTVSKYITVEGGGCGPMGC